MIDLPNEDVERLLKRISRNNNKAATELYKHYSGLLVVDISRKMFLNRDEIVVAELVQEVFLTVLKKPLAYDGKCKFSTWLKGIAKNKILAHKSYAFKQQERYPHPYDEETPIDRNVELNWSVTAPIEQSERNEVMLGCMEKLSPNIREEMFLTYYQEHSIEEIAKIQNCSKNTVKTRLYQSRKKIRSCIERAYGTTELEGVL